MIFRAGEKGEKCEICQIELEGRLRTIIDGCSLCITCSTYFEETNLPLLEHKKDAQQGEFGGQKVDKFQEDDDNYYNRYYSKDNLYKPVIRRDEKIDIGLEPLAYKKILYYIDACNTETSGLFSVKKVKESLYIVEDVFLLHNHASGGYTDIDKDAMIKMMTAFHKEGKSWDSMKGWWHSHCDMGTFWSGTDDSTAERLGIFDPSNPSPFWVSIVGNKRHELRGRVDIFTPEHIILNDDINCQVSLSEDVELRKACIAETKVKVKPYVWKDNWKNNNWNSKKWRKKHGKFGKKSRERRGFNNAEDLWGDTWTGRDYGTKYGGQKFRKRLFKTAGAY